MSSKAVDVTLLVDEYKTLISELPTPDQPDFELLKLRLVKWSDWTDSGADTLIQITRDYGQFMLRNALALAVAMGIEDGGQGY